jgi:hypothetical protein
MHKDEQWQLNQMVQQMKGVAMVMAASARAHARIEGMKAVNAERDRQGEVVAYPEQCFLDVIEGEGIGINTVVNMLNP